MTTICKSLSESERAALGEIVNQKAAEFMARNEIKPITSEGNEYNQLTTTIDCMIQAGDSWERADGQKLARQWNRIFDRATGNTGAKFFAWGNLCK